MYEIVATSLMLVQQYEPNIVVRVLEFLMLFLGVIVFAAGIVFLYGSLKERFFDDLTTIISVSLGFPVLMLLVFLFVSPLPGAMRAVYLEKHNNIAELEKSMLDGNIYAAGFLNESKFVPKNLTSKIRFYSLLEETGADIEIDDEVLEYVLLAHPVEDKKWSDINKRADKLYASKALKHELKNMARIRVDVSDSGFIKKSKKYGLQFSTRSLVRNKIYHSLGPYMYFLSKSDKAGLHVKINLYDSGYISAKKWGGGFKASVEDKGVIPMVEFTAKLDGKIIAFSAPQKGVKGKDQVEVVLNSIGALVISKIKPALLDALKSKYILVSPRVLTLFLSEHEREHIWWK